MRRSDGGTASVFRRAYHALPPSPESGRIARISHPEPPPQWSFREYIRLLLQGKYHMIGEAPPKFGHVDHVEQAKRIYRKARLPIGCDPRWICAELGIRVKAKALPEHTREVYANGRILYPMRRGPREWGLSVAHGILHHENEVTWCGEWAHVDVWYATFELMLPSDTLFLVGLEKAKEAFSFAPEWLIDDYWDTITGQM